MKQILFLIFLTNLYHLPIHSQTFNELGVDTVRIACLYQQVCVRDTLKPQKKIDNPMLLQIGNHCTKYYSVHNYLDDSISRVLVAQIVAGQKFSGQEAFNEHKKNPMKRVPTEVNFHIYKHYPQKGQLTLRDHFGGEGIWYEEALPEMKWNLTNDTLTVCNYLCKKATTTFRGRNYTVWYAREIPVSDGPWKFNGLPGLILKAIDEQRYFSFECMAIETPQTLKLIQYDGFGRKVGRPEYNKAKQRYMDNPGAYLSGSPMMAESSPLPATSYQKRPYNPIERTDE